MESLMRNLVSTTVLLSAGLATSAFSKGAVKNFELAHIPGQAIIGFESGVDVETKTALMTRSGARILHVFKTGAMLVEFKGKMNQGIQNLVMGELVKSKDISYVEANTVIFADSLEPNDPRYGELYGLNNVGATGGAVDADIDAPEAWSVTTGSKDVVVAIIDTGVDYNHPDIAPNYWNNPAETGLDGSGLDKSTNGIDDDGNGFIDDFRGWDFVNNDNDPMDDHNHGTHCAGTIGAKGDDGVGVVGVNWNVSMVGVKFLSGSGSGSLADAVKAIEYTTGLGVTLTSNSWGGGGYSDTMYAAINAANSAGVLFVAAAGNSSANNDLNPHYPSSYDSDNVIAVAATDHVDGMAGFSCFGLNSVDVGAPGKDILSTVASNGYASYSGTSMATPHVSGLAALVKSAYPDATAAQIKARILNTADVIPSLEGKTVTGGRVNAFNALENDSIAPGSIASLGISDTGTTSVSLNWAGAGDDADVGQAKRYEVRLSAQPISDDASWNAATKVSAQTSIGQDNNIAAVVNGLAFNSSGYLAVKAVDNVGNFGPISETLRFAVRQVAKVAENTADNMDGIVADAPWGIQVDTTTQATSFSDSPDLPYANDANVAMTMDTINVDSSDVTLSLRIAHDFEAGYDFGFIEISTDDGTTWSELDKISGASGWKTNTYSLSSKLGEARSFKLRFRVTADFSIVKDGWQIDDVAIYAPM
jgi:subtilisin family serine protease